jgi:ankyrin repeat protein
MNAGELFEDPQTAALAEAAGAGETDRVHELVRQGASVNSVSHRGATPLLWALSQRNKAGVVALLREGADPNLVVPGGFTAISSACGLEDPELLRLMLEHGGNPNLTSGNGEPLLHTAITAERWDNVELLLTYGANINSRNTMGLTPVLLCAYLDQYQRVFYLLQKGADFFAVADNGSTLASEIDESYLDRDSEQGEWLQRVRSLLIDRGVQFPAPKLG